MFVWFKGQCIPQENAVIPITDRGFLYGEGIFRTLKVNDGVIELYELHLNRFQHDCQALNLEPPPIDPSWIRELIAANQAQNGVWRLKWISTASSGLLMTLESYKPTTITTRLGYYPEPVQSPTSRIKSLSFLDRHLLTGYAERNGLTDVIVKSSEGYIMEASMANLFWKQGKTLYFPDPTLSFLEGVTVQTISRMCVTKGWDTQFVKSYHIPSDASLFLCNSMRGIVPIDSVDGIPCLPEHSFRRELTTAFREYAEPFHFK